MKKIYAIFLLAVFCFASASTYAVELVYKWKAGTVYRFQTVQTDDVSMSVNMMGMNTSQKDIYKSESIFVLKIISVLPNGTADAILYVENYKVTNKAGKLLASLANLPKEALKTSIEIDKKGNFTVKKEIHLIIQDGATILVSGKANGNKVEASATYPDGQKVSVHAEFDPRTGTLKGGYTVQNIGKPVEKKVAIKEDSKEIEVIPYNFLQMLKLPDGDVKAGQTATVKSAGYDMTIKTESILNNIATMTCDFKTDMKKTVEENSTGKTTTNVNSNDGDGNNMNMDMNTDMNNMDMGGNDFNTGDMNGNMNGNNMNMNGNMNTGMTTEEKQMIPDSKTDGKITVTFDTLKGVFRNMNGTITSSMNSMGMEMDVKTTLTMKGL